jgi:DNA-binding NtrC family response regulator
MTRQPNRVLSHPDANGSAASHAKAVIFSDPASQALLHKIERIAPSEAPVLIVGETGTGKELVARHIHAKSGRAGAFVAVNCGALSQSLAEAELFGHQAGSFTGANETRAGWFETANDGTLFLDEIGDLPNALQVKLLRVLQEREVVRVGARKAIPLDVRIVAATNVNLADAVAQGRFRLDLYYRLNVVSLELLPLRARLGDVGPLFEFFISNYAEKLRVDVPQIASATQHALLAYPWPGNIRELENVAQSALLIHEDDVVRPQDLQFAAMPHLTQLAAARALAPLEAISAQLDRMFAEPQVQLFDTLEQLIVKREFAHAKGNQVHAARLLGVSRNAMRTLLRRAGLLSAVSADSEVEVEEVETIERDG